MSVERDARAPAGERGAVVGEGSSPKEATHRTVVPRALAHRDALAELATRLRSLSSALRGPAVDAPAIARMLADVERCRELVAAADRGGDEASAGRAGVREVDPLDAHRPANDGGDPRLARALAALRRRLGGPWTVAALARIAGMSRAAFARLFTRTLGAPPLKHLATMRMREAQRLLLETDEKLAAIAGLLGYASEFAFSRAFKQHVGVAPAIHRRRERERRRLGAPPARGDAGRWRVLGPSAHTLAVA